MKYENIRNNLIQNLFTNIKLLDKVVLVLEISYKKCINIGIKDAYSEEELEKYELLTSRFSRVSDILTQKVFRTILKLLQEDAFTIIDIANFMEKIGLIDNANNLISLRSLRNSIAHEYKEEDILILFSEVVTSIPTLFDIINSTKKYINEKFEETV
jgi:hypothetical protein